MSLRTVDLTGQRFGRLVVTGRNYESVSRYAMWNFTCDCGGAGITRTSSLNNGHTKSCGCIQKESASSFAKATHGLRGSSEYRIWSLIKDRCLNSKTKAFRYYGGRGITVCDRWKDSFENFIEDMGPRPSPKHSIDRTNNDGNYEPGNCRWATRVQQMNNKRSNVNITFNGVTKTAAQWSREVSVRSATLRARIFKYGWSAERALTEAVK
jgi:hypothetical protein